MRDPITKIHNRNCKIEGPSVTHVFHLEILWQNSLFGNVRLKARGRRIPVRKVRFPAESLHSNPLRHRKLKKKWQAAAPSWNQKRVRNNELSNRDISKVSRTYPLHVTVPHHHDMVTAFPFTYHFQFEAKPIGRSLSPKEWDVWETLTTGTAHDAIKSIQIDDNKKNMAYWVWCCMSCRDAVHRSGVDQSFGIDDCQMYHQHVNEYINYLGRGELLMKRKE
jgi:hypothetical protein